MAENRLSREEKLREIAEQEQALMREIYGFDNGVAYERERIIELLREKAIDLKRIAESIDEDEYANAGDGDFPYWGSFALDDFADALIKGEKE